MTEQNSYIDQAFILCAGLGTRLRPHTLERPKPLVEVNGQSLLARTIDHLRAAGIRKAVLNTHYLAEQIAHAVSDITDMEIILSCEEELLDTGGGIKKALHHFEGRDFFVFSGDGLWEDRPQASSLTMMQKQWNRDKMDILMLLQPTSSMTLTHGVGDYDLSADGHAVRSAARTGTHMFTSMRINRVDIFDNTPDGPFSYLQLMDDAQEKGRLFGMAHQGDWHHISSPEDLDKVRAHYAEMAA